ncbi:MAG TPA: MbtH family protein [Steroidobacteraceae bacterium]|nr:MbtH family protein [Steroidobacteraceae bacterium]
MANPFDEESAQFLVVVNDEGQHSIWPTFREIPRGWRASGKPGTRQECLDWIEIHWTDLRPQSLIDADARAKS